MPHFNDPLPTTFTDEFGNRPFTGGSASPDGTVEFYYQNEGQIAPSVGTNDPASRQDHDAFANPYRPTSTES